MAKISKRMVFKYAVFLRMVQRTAASLKNAISLVKRIENNLERRL